VKALKALKAVSVSRGIEAKRTHDLVALATPAKAIVVNHAPQLDDLSPAALPFSHTKVIDLGHSRVRAAAWPTLAGQAGSCVCRWR
jgi:hypothetical protein